MIEMIFETYLLAVVVFVLPPCVLFIFVKARLLEKDLSSIQDQMISIGDGLKNLSKLLLEEAYSDYCKYCTEFKLEIESFEIFTNKVLDGRIKYDELAPKR